MNGYQMVGESIVMNSGFAEYAVTNNMILLFPQAEFHYLKNIGGCWNLDDTNNKTGPGI